MKAEIKAELVSSWGDDRSVAYQAWASTYDLEKLANKSMADVDRVVTAVIQNHHQTPKERVFLDFFITCPIACERQLDKYRMSIQHQGINIECEVGILGRWGITQNELSGRYRTIPERWIGMPKDVAAILVKCEADNESVILNWDDFLATQHEEYKMCLDELRSYEKKNVITNVEYKRAREFLRMMLGTGYMTDMRMVMNLGAFEHIINQRLAPESQMETRLVAYYMLQAVKTAQVAPTTIEEMIKVNGWTEWQAEVKKYLEDQTET